MGRLWQTVLLTRFHPIIEFTPVESVVKDRQSEYYQALGLSDKEGSLSSVDRLEIARKKFRAVIFTRKEYMQIFKTIATATASRDLALGIKRKIPLLL
ncbi:MAG: hypothetical protein A2Z20_04205 [Bdellovibrionales bacterium RBG_16_40_8]|nr:MAG: hypothetical protein A2Z20_04205 [Bdellovibrionales bacterium RBG_16_40_8]